MDASDKIPAAGYVRVSTLKQANNESPEIQRQRIQQYCDLHNLELVKIYEDAMSGAKDDRPALNELFTDSEKRNFQRVLFTRLDRFGRSLKFILECYDKLEKLGISVISIYENIDTSTPTGILLRNILGTLAQFERTRIQERLEEGKYAKASRKEILPVPRLPYGYFWVKEKKQIVINPEEGKVVKKIFDIYINDKLSIYETCERLNREGYRTKKGGLWWNASLRFILRNPHYTGQMVYYKKDDSPITFDIPPLITASRHHKALERLKQGADRSLLPSHVKQDDPFLLRGMLTCGQCGSKMISVNEKGKTRIYVCHWAQPKNVRHMTTRGKKCDMPRLSAPKIEEEFMNRIWFHLYHPKALLRQLEKERGDFSGLENEIDSLQKKIEREDLKKSRILDLFSEDGIQRKDLMGKFDEINLKVSQLQEQKAELGKKVNLLKGKSRDIEILKRDMKELRHEGYERIAKVIKKLDSQQKKEFLRTIMDGRITVSKDGQATGTYNLEKGYEWLSKFTFIS